MTGNHGTAALRVLAIALLLAGCSENKGSGGNGDQDGPGVGEEGGACYSNRTCDPGLTCNAGDVCERVADADADADADTDADADSDTDADTDTDSDSDADADSDADTDTDADWPPTDPWWAGRDCALPACDDQAGQQFDLSGLWTQTLTTVAHSCGPWAEMGNPKLKPGHVETTTDMSFDSRGECNYSDGGTVLSGVIHGNIEISCSIVPDDQGVHVLQTGVVTYDGNRGVGSARVFLFDLPMGLDDCDAEYEVVFERQ